MSIFNKLIYFHSTQLPFNCREDYSLHLKTPQNRRVGKIRRPMKRKGPSPLVPSLMVGVLGLVIFGPTLLSMLEFVMPLFEAGDSDGGSFYVVMVLVLLLLLVLVQLLSTFFPIVRMFSTPSVQRTSSSASDDGFGLGTILLVVLFLVLYKFWSD